MLYDTDILIWIFRGNEAAARVIEEDPGRFLSVISYMELLRGAKDRREARLLKSFLSDLRFSLLPLTENIGHRASIYMEEFASSSGLRVADALIAATAAENRFALCTGDHRHFQLIRELELAAFRP
jgi:predicted nucleic acid-binding protein